jgi:1,4-dihydroxy-2-naphthoyl-CoA hydrolase
VSIWFGTPTLDDANGKRANSMIEHLGIEFVELTDDMLAARMPVDHRTRQPAGVLHGGASVVLAETLASWAATFAVDRAQFHCVGMEINANHLRPVADGWVRGEARAINIGRTTQVWEIRITNDAGKLVCISRCTMAALPVPSQY